MRASMTVPRAGEAGAALSSMICDCRSRISISSLMPWPVVALVRTTSVSPPHSTGFNPCPASWPRTMSGLASGRSILFIATTIGTSAARAWLIDSIVCGWTPSTALTTRTTTSVMFAPRARMAVNAWWPGVSMKVTRFASAPSPVVTTHAAVCCVMPPDSPAATLALRILSRRLVLPWSTWPRIVTTGGRVARTVSSVRSVANSASNCSSSVASALMTSSSPYSIVMPSAVSRSRPWLTVTKMPCLSNLPMMSELLMPRAAESDLTVIGSSM